MVSLLVGKKKNSCRLKTNYCKQSRTLFVNSHTSEHGYITVLIKLLVEKLCVTQYVVDAFSNYRCVADQCKHCFTVNTNFTVDGNGY